MLECYSCWGEVRKLDYLCISVDMFVPVYGKECNEVKCLLSTCHMKLSLGT